MTANRACTIMQMASALVYVPAMVDVAPLTAAESRPPAIATPKPIDACCTVCKTPEAAPAMAGGMSAIMAPTRGPNMSACPAPTHISSVEKVHEFSSACWRKMDVAVIASRTAWMMPPAMRSLRKPTLTARLADQTDTAKKESAKGSRTSAVCIGVQPRPVCVVRA